MSLSQSIYDHSPGPIQNALVSVDGFRRNRKRYGALYWETRKWLEEFDSWPLERKLAYQDETVVDFVSWATRNSPYYAGAFSGLSLSNLSGVDSLTLLPILEKETLRNDIERIMTVGPKGVVEGHTGGTTGKSLVVRFTVEDAQRRMAMLDHFKARVGFENRKMRRATFSGKHIIPPGRHVRSYWRYNAPTRQMLYSTFHMSEVNLGKYVASLNDFRPQAIDGFFSSLCLLADYIERKGIELTFRPVAVFPTSETVTPHKRRQVERVFSAKVYDQYASSEGAPFVTECRAGRLHVELSSGVFEPVSDNTSEILVTSFTTHGTPLIRYRIGDAMEISDDPGVCDCGVASRFVDVIHGRGQDFLWKADGSQVNAGNLANLFKNFTNSVIQAQLVQRELGRVRMYLQVDRGRFSESSEKALIEEFRHKFDRDTVLEVEYVERIPQTAGGKTPFIRNEVS